MQTIKASEFKAKYLSLMDRVNELNLFKKLAPSSNLSIDRASFIVI